MALSILDINHDIILFYGVQCSQTIAESVRKRDRNTNMQLVREI